MIKARDFYRSIRRRIQRATRRPPVGRVDLGDLDRLTPISRNWGFDRGQPIDRFYIERFVEARAADIRGRVLEVSNNEYTRRFGGERVTRSDILHPFDGNPRATVIADLARPEPELEQQFDCIICTQTLPFIYEARAAVRQLHDWLKPGGVALVTVPGISQVSREDMQLTGDYWRFSSVAVGLMFADAFSAGTLEIESWGNVLSAVALLHGIAAEEFDLSDLLEVDNEYEVITTVRAVRGKPQ
jgi:SAM-dependent methyltransferase